MDLRGEITRQLTWTDWEAMENLLRRKMQARVDADPTLSDEDKALARLDVRDSVLAFGEVYRFARHDHAGMYAAVYFALDQRFTLDQLRDSVSPFDLMRFFEEVDIFGVPTRKASPGNASAASETISTGGQ